MLRTKKILQTRTRKKKRRILPGRMRLLMQAGLPTRRISLRKMRIIPKMERQLKIVI